MLLSQIPDSIDSRRLKFRQQGARSDYILPYKIRQIKVSEEGDYERRNNFCDSFLREVHGGVRDSADEVGSI
jgi:hypothetical protein